MSHPKDKSSGKINSTEALYLANRVAFHCRNSRFVNSSGERWIIKTYRELRSWIDGSPYVLNRSLKKIRESGQFCTSRIIVRGEKALKIFLKEDFKCKMHIGTIEALKETGINLDSAVILSEIIFRFRNSIISHDGMRWCAITKEYLASKAAIGTTKLDEVIKLLIDKGFITKKLFIHGRDTVTHYHIPDNFLNHLDKRIAERIQEDKDRAYEERAARPSLPSKFTKPFYKNKKDLFESKTDKFLYKLTSKKFTLPNDNEQLSMLNGTPKTPSSIYIDIDKLNNNNINNNITTINDMEDDKPTGVGFPLFSEKIDDSTQVNGELTGNQKNYIKKALINSLKKTPSNECMSEWMDELTFSIENHAVQHRGVYGFRHLVNRCMKIIRNGDWKKPIGFNKYCDAGKKFQEDLELVYKKHEERKHFRKEQAKRILVTEGKGEDKRIPLSQSVNITSKKEENECTLMSKKEENKKIVIGKKEESYEEYVTRMKRDYSDFEYIPQYKPFRASRLQSNDEVNELPMDQSNDVGIKPLKDVSVCPINPNYRSLVRDKSGYALNDANKNRIESNLKDKNDNKIGIYLKDKNSVAKHSFNSTGISNSEIKSSDEAPISFSDYMKKKGLEGVSFIQYMDLKRNKN